MSKKARPEHIAAMRLLASRGRQREPVVAASVLRYTTGTPRGRSEGARTRVKLRGLSDDESVATMAALRGAQKVWPHAVGYLLREAALAGNITYRRAA